MALITRPTKSSSGGSTSWIAGADILADEVNTDFDTLYADYNGNITDANCAAGMALQGSKIADAPNGISTAKLNTDAVTTIKILNNNVTKAKLAAASVSADKLDNTETTNAAQINLPLNNDVFWDSGISHASRQAIAVYNIIAPTGGASLTKMFLVKGGGGNWLVQLQQVNQPVTPNIPIGGMGLYHIAKT